MVFGVYSTQNGQWFLHGLGGRGKGMFEKLATSSHILNYTCWGVWVGVWYQSVHGWFIFKGHYPHAPFTE